MSIPPLVCSTPPPPEQIECDERLHDEFTIPYDLSQEDEDFSTEVDFNSALPTCTDSSIFLENSSNSSVDIRPSDIILPEKFDSKSSNECNNDCGSLPSNIECNNKCGNSPLDGKIIDEDNNIEDLGLKYEITEKLNTDSSNKSDEKANDSSSGENTNDLFSINSIEISVENENNETPDHLLKPIASDVIPVFPDNNNTDLKIDSSPAPIPEPVMLESYQSEETNFNKKEEPTNQNTSTNTENVESIHQGDEYTNFATADLNLGKDVFSNPGSNMGIVNKEKNLKTDYSIRDDDFDTFHFTGCDENSLTSDVDQFVLPCADPWSSDANPTEEFGAFQATFDDKIQHSDSVTKYETEKQYENNDTVDEDDEFGDFDDFQSSAHPSQMSNEADTSTPFILKMPDNQNQLFERIEKTIHSLFQEQIPDEKKSVQSNLESLLSVTWGHLTETEIRQPYMLNWNNSISQKALLKSLNIDSRNILFGPKWSNMPRYAANLGSSPLQPVKQTTNNMSAFESMTQRSEDKPKPVDTWTDTVSDGQESCNDNQSKVESEPEQTRVLTEEILKPSKTFSATLPLQPIRQISLPDTHIFTPTDSQTPRSQTIHYNIDSFCKLPSVSNNILQQEETVKSETKDDEFDDFQDFKASTVEAAEEKKQKTDEKVSAPFYQTQSILEPIKLEPVMPTLNWPQPGEVKEVFDDFTDFVSNLTWNTSQNINGNKMKVDEFPVQNNVNDTFTSTQNTQIETKPVGSEKAVEEDEFDNFQFAPLPAQVSKLPTVPKLQPHCDNMQPSPLVNTLANNELLHPMKPLQLQSTSIPANKAPSVSSQVLKVAPLEKSSPEKGASHQILQPLSLESISQIHWPRPGVDLQNLSSFNPVNALHSLNNSPAKQTSSTHASKNQDDDGWGDFVSIKPSVSTSFSPKRAEDDDWSDFVSNSTPKTHNGVNTISFNVQTNLAKKSSPQMTRLRQDDPRVSIPTLNYVTPNSNQKFAKDNQFQNL